MLRPGTFGGLSHISDLLPTFLSVAEIPLGTDLDGISLWGSLIEKRDESPRTESVFRSFVRRFLEKSEYR